MYKKETLKIHQAKKEITKYINKWGGKLAWDKSLLDEIKHSISSFKELYYSVKGDRTSHASTVQKIKSALRFKTSLKTARALKENKALYLATTTKKGKAAKRPLKFVKKAITDLSLKDIRQSTTREIAEIFKEDIKAMYHQLRAKGLGSKEAAKRISSFYFGS